MRDARLTLETLEDRCLLAARITELPIPAANISLEGITAGPDGNLWYTSFNSNRVGRITPAGTVAEVEAGSAPNGGPVGITAGPDGNLWYTLKNSGRIGRVTPAGFVIEFAAGSTATVGPEGIAAGIDGNLWFTQRFAGRIGRITPEGVVTEFTLPGGPVSQPVGITAGPDGNLWFVEYAANMVGRITPGGQVTEFVLPTPNSGPFAITTGPDGNLWFTQRNAHRVGRVTVDGKITEFALPTLNGLPVGITAGPDGNVWFTERNGGKIGVITPTGQITELDVLTPNAQPYAITFGARRDLAFTQLGATGNRVGLVSGVVDTGPGFIQALYRKALNRFAAPAELESWNTFLAHSNTWVVANAIERSPEARTRLVKGWYVTHLGRLPGLGEEQHWVRLMLAGMAEEQVLSGILGSPEYYNRTARLVGAAAASTDEHFVRALFRQVLGRDAGEVEVANFQANILPKFGRHGTAWIVLNSAEHRGNVVQAYYWRLLGRTAMATEVNAWVFARPWHDLTMLRVGFESSGEFYVNG